MINKISKPNLVVSKKYIKFITCVITFFIAFSMFLWAAVEIKDSYALVQVRSFLTSDSAAPWKFFVIFLTLAALGWVGMKVTQSFLSGMKKLKNVKAFSEGVFELVLMGAVLLSFVAAYYCIDGITDRFIISSLETLLR